MIDTNCSFCGKPATFIYADISECLSCSKVFQKVCDWYESESKSLIDEIMQLEQELQETREQLNNSLNFHCPHFLTSGSGFVSCHYDKEQELRKTREQLKKAEKVIEFYADGYNYEHISPEIATYSVIDVSDLGAGDFMLNDSVDDERVGGKRARQYFKDKQGE